MLDLKRPIYRQTAAYGHMGGGRRWPALENLEALAGMPQNIYQRMARQSTELGQRTKSASGLSDTGGFEKLAPGVLRLQISLSRCLVDRNIVVFLRLPRNGFEA